MCNNSIKYYVRLTFGKGLGSLCGANAVNINIDDFNAHFTVKSYVINQLSPFRFQFPFSVTD